MLRTLAFCAPSLRPYAYSSTHSFNSRVSRLLRRRRSASLSSAAPAAWARPRGLSSRQLALFSPHRDAEDVPRYLAHPEQRRRARAVVLSAGVTQSVACGHANSTARPTAPLEAYMSSAGTRTWRYMTSTLSAKYRRFARTFRMTCTPPRIEWAWRHSRVKTNRRAPSRKGGRLTSTHAIRAWTACSSIEDTAGLAIWHAGVKLAAASPAKNDELEGVSQKRERRRHVGVACE